MKIYLSFAIRWTGWIIHALMLAGCAKLVQEQVTMPPRDLSATVQSLSIKPFASSPYGARLAEELRNQLANEGYIQVSSQGGEAALSGALTLDRVSHEPPA